jgi:hypothetical protein
MKSDPILLQAFPKRTAGGCVVDRREDSFSKGKESQKAPGKAVAPTD